MATVEDAIDKTIESNADKNEYRIIELSNGLVATLISRPKVLEDPITTEIEEDGWVIVNEASKKEPIDSSFKFYVDVGWNSDPVEKPGLAHLLQHVIPSCSEKYPEVNSFENFVHTNGGKYTSSTTQEKTSFFFNTKEGHLLTTIDRFSEFISTSFINEESMIREIEKIDPTITKSENPQTTCRSEPCKIICGINDNRRNKFSNLLNSLLIKTHPEPKFSGYDSEKNQLIDTLKNFKARHYSAHRMSLVVESDFSPDTLEQCVRECFSKIPNNNLPADDFGMLARENSLTNQDFTKFFKIDYSEYSDQEHPVTKIYLNWKIPVRHDWQKHAPDEYLRHILSSTTEGSLNYYLQQKKLSYNLNLIYFSDYSDSVSKCWVVTLIFSVAKNGRDRIKEILDSVFSMINKLRTEEPSEDIFNGIKRFEQLWYRWYRCKGEDIYSNKKQEIQKLLSPRMHFDTQSHYFAKAPFIEFSSEAIKNCVNLLTPEKVNIMLVDSKLKKEDFKEVLPWYGTRYSCEDIPESWIADWKNIKPLPEFDFSKLKNPFSPNCDLTQELDSTIKVSEIPRKMFQNETIEVWHSADSKKDEYNKYKCRFAVDIISPSLKKSIETSISLQILRSCLEDIKNRDRNNLDNTNSFIQYKNIADGIIIESSCHRENLSQVLHKALKYVADCHKLVTKDLFELGKETALRVYSFECRPDNFTKQLLTSFIDKNSRLPTDKKAAVLEIDYDQFIQFTMHFAEKLYFKCMILGDLKEEDLKQKISESISGFDFGLKVPEVGENKEFYEIPLGNTYCEVESVWKNNEISSSLHYYQIIDSKAHDFVKLSAMVELLEELTSKPLDEFKKENDFRFWAPYKFLKSIQARTKGSIGFTVEISYETYKFTPKEINEKLDDFIKRVVILVKNMTVDEFSTCKANLIESQLRYKFYENFLLINRTKQDNIMLDESNLFRSVVNNLKLNEFLQFVDNHIVNHRKLNLHVVGANKNSESSDQPEICLDVSHPNVLTKKTKNSSDDKCYYVKDIDSFKTNLNKYNQPETEFTSCICWLCSLW